MAGIQKGNTIPSKTMTGARAMVMINGQVIGFFSNAAVTCRQSKEPIYVLGAYAPVELCPTTQDVISLTLTGFKQQGKGPYAIGAATLANELIKEGEFDVTVIDRQQANFASSMDQNYMGNRKDAATLKGKRCRLVSWSTGFAARGISDLRLEVVGLEIEDESIQDGGNHENSNF